MGFQQLALVNGGFSQPTDSFEVMPNRSGNDRLAEVSLSGQNPGLRLTVR